MTKTIWSPARPDTTLEQAKEILQKHKVEKLLLVNDKGELAGLITMRDIDRFEQYPQVRPRQPRAAAGRGGGRASRTTTGSRR